MPTREPLQTSLELAEIETIDDAIRVMRALDATLPPHDGVRWFNAMYLRVTERVRADLARGLWRDPEWLERLDVVFARYYFRALVTWRCDRTATPLAWRTVLARRHVPGVARIQHAVAGMNAHINRDLALAVRDTCEELGVRPDRGTRWHRDFERVNEVLAEEELGVMRELSAGVLASVQRAMNHADDRLAVWSIRRMRDAAWAGAELLWRWRESPTAAAGWCALLDRVTAATGRRVLVRAGPLFAAPAELRTPPRRAA